MYYGDEALLTYVNILHDVTNSVNEAGQGTPRKFEFDKSAHADDYLMHPQD